MKNKNIQRFLRNTCIYILLLLGMLYLYFRFNTNPHNQSRASSGFVYSKF